VTVNVRIKPVEKSDFLYFKIRTFSPRGFPGEASAKLARHDAIVSGLIMPFLVDITALMVTEKARAETGRKLHESSDPLFLEIETTNM
jgi:hypothetical protein